MWENIKHQWWIIALSCLCLVLVSVAASIGNYYLMGAAIVCQFVLIVVASLRAEKR